MGVPLGAPEGVPVGAPLPGGVGVDPALLGVERRV